MEKSSYDLAYFVNGVAIEIDNHIIGRDKVDYDTIFKFGKFLYDLTLNDLIHYTSIIIKPIEKYRGKKFDNKSKIKDLSESLINICDDLERFNILQKKQQEKLRDFCVNVSRNAIDYQYRCFFSRRNLVA